jgi:dedicator of cytokinesis protein 3
LRLHGQLCPPEFVPFHETLEIFFKKNFREEIERLFVEGSSDQLTTSPSLKPAASQYQGSMYEHSLQRTMSTTSTTRPPLIPPLQLGEVMVPPPLPSPQSLRTTESGPPAKQTPLQRHMAHLARHGMNGLSSAPGEHSGGSESISAGSPRESLVNVVNSNGVSVANAGFSGASLASTSNLGSLSGSIKGRLSRFGSLNFGRRGPSNA